MEGSMRKKDKVRLSSLAYLVCSFSAAPRGRVIASRHKELHVLRANVLSVFMLCLPPLATE